MTRDLPAAGIHSLFSEADRNGTQRERHIVLGDLDSKAPLLQPREFRAEAQFIMRAHGVLDLYINETLKGVHVWSPWLQSLRFASAFEEAFHRWGRDEFHPRWMIKNGGSVLRLTPKPGEGDPCALCKIGLDDNGDVGGWVCTKHGSTGRARYDVPFGCTEYAGDGERCPIQAIEEGAAMCPRCFGTGWTGPRYVTHLKIDAAEAAPWSFWSKTHWAFMQARYGIPQHHAPQLPERGVECSGVRLEHYWTHAPKQEAVQA